MQSEEVNRLQCYYIVIVICTSLYMYLSSALNASFYEYRPTTMQQSARDSGDASFAYL